MAQHVRAPKLETRTARLKRPIRPKPYFHKIERGLHLGYRRNKTSGTWIVRVTSNKQDWTDAIGTADDIEGVPNTLTFIQAQDEARKRAKIGPAYDASTVGGAIDAYEAALKERGGDPANVKRLRYHLPPGHDLLGKTVGLLTTQDLSAFRTSLLGKMETVTVNRNCTVLRAALNHAADHSDGRITNRDAWTVGLKAIECLTNEPRNVILDEPAIRAIIAQCYALKDVGEAFGLYIETLAVTGTRTSQADRLNGDDVEMGSKPKLMMPSSRKGKKKQIRFRVPIPDGLAQRLSGKTGPLFLRPDGEGWTDWDRRRLFAKAVKAAGLDPAVVTPYALRHSSIVRMLLATNPTISPRVIAALHDTSIKMIEQTYSRYILDHSDDLARSAMLDTTTATVHPFPAKEAVAG